MVDHWEAFGPPVYISVAGYLGLGKGRKKPGDKSSSSKYGNLEDLVSMFGSTGGVIQ